jgi:hypothetical protein
MHVARVPVQATECHPLGVEADAGAPASAWDAKRALAPAGARSLLVRCESALGRSGDARISRKAQATIASRTERVPTRKGVMWATVQLRGGEA